MSTKWILRLIFISLVSILIGSVSHLHHTFYSIEQKGVINWMIAFILSAGIEAAMLGIAFGVVERRRLKQSAKDLYFWLLLFGLINFFANTYYAVSIYLDEDNLLGYQLDELDWLVRLKFFILSSSLPILVLSLTELFSIFQEKMKYEEKMRKTLEAKEKIGQVLTIEEKITKEELTPKKKRGRPKKGEEKNPKIELPKRMTSAIADAAQLIQPPVKVEITETKDLLDIPRRKPIDEIQESSKETQPIQN